MWRYSIVDLPRADGRERNDALWELGRGGWELVQVLDGSQADPSDRSRITLVFKRSASEDIGV